MATINIDVNALRDDLDAYIEEHGGGYTTMSRDMGYCANYLSNVLYSGSMGTAGARNLELSYGIKVKEDKPVVKQRAGNDKVWIALLGDWNVEVDVQPDVRKVVGRIVHDGVEVCSAYAWIRTPVTEASIVQAVSYCTHRMQMEYGSKHNLVNWLNGGADTNGKAVGR